MKRGENWVPLAQREKVPFIHVLGICAGTLAPTLLWTVVFALFTPLATKLKLASITQTLVLLSGSVIGFFMQPLVGVWSDGLMLKWGRRRIFMLSGAICLVLGLLLMMFCVEIGKSLLQQQVVLIVGIVIVFFSGNVMQGPTRTLCSDSVPHHQQVLVSNIVGCYGGFGGVFTNLVGALGLYEYTNLTQEQFILIVCLAISAVSIACEILVTPEEPLAEKPPSQNPFKTIIIAFKNMPRPFIRIAISYFFAMIACYEIGVQLSHFMGYTVFGGDNSIDASPEMVRTYQKGLSWAMMCNLVSCGVQFLYGFVATKVSDFIGLKWVFFIFLIILGVCYLLFFFLKNQYVYLVLHVFIGMAVVTYNNVPQAIVSMCIPSEELGANLGLLNCFNVVGQQIANWGIGAGMNAVWKNKPGHLIGISCIFAFLAAISALFIIVPEKRADDDKEEMQEMSSSSTDDKPEAL